MARRTPQNGPSPISKNNFRELAVWCYRNDVDSMSPYTLKLPQHVKPSTFCKKQQQHHNQMHHSWRGFDGVKRRPPVQMYKHQQLTSSSNTHQHDNNETINNKNKSSMTNKKGQKGYYGSTLMTNIKEHNRIFSHHSDTTETLNAYREQHLYSRYKGMMTKAERERIQRTLLLLHDVVTNNSSSRTAESPSPSRLSHHQQQPGDNPSPSPSNNTNTFTTTTLNRIPPPATKVRQSKEKFLKSDMHVWSSAANTEKPKMETGMPSDNNNNADKIKHEEEEKLMKETQHELIKIPPPNPPPTPAPARLTQARGAPPPTPQVISHRSVAAHHHHPPASASHHHYNNRQNRGRICLPLSVLNLTMSLTPPPASSSPLPPSRSPPILHNKMYNRRQTYHHPHYYNATHLVGMLIKL